MLTPMILPRNDCPYVMNISCLVSFHLRARTIMTKTILSIFSDKHSSGTQKFNDLLWQYSRKLGFDPGLPGVET